MNKFYGTKKKHSYFEGWYVKHENGEETVAMIPAYHIDENGNAGASIQVITDEGAYCALYGKEAFHADKKGFAVLVGESLFKEKSCHIHIDSSQLQMDGNLYYEPFLPLPYDIMGPFSLMPGMQCRHSVLSLYHKVKGNMVINGRKYNFSKGHGYIEGDRGCSFPEQYMWTQWNSSKGVGAMLSIATIPFLKSKFTGCIGIVHVGQEQFRFATYLGVKICKLTKDHIVVKQGSLKLEIHVLAENPYKLSSPQKGNMSGTIHESPSATVRYHFQKGNTVIFDVTTNRAGYEWSKKSN